MARPTKEGLDYFPLYVDIFEDEKIEAISGEFGIKGEIVVIKLLCAIYKNGYFILWNDLTIAQMLKRLPGISKDLLNNIVERLVLWEFFNKDLFHSVGILTSENIQDIFLEATKRRKSPKPTLYMIDENQVDNDNEIVNVNNNSQADGVNVDINAQSKEKESKEKESIERDSISIYLSLFNNALKNKTDKFCLSQIARNYDLDLLYQEICKSSWLKENLVLVNASNKFLNKILKGHYRNFKKIKSENSFKNFKQQTDSMSDEDLEDLARAKRDKIFKELKDD
ncbi:DUF4373 domain-containing protein [Peptoniphilus obesi]|uniref:DUF4373 domain-containing protein n=1 Tax=Peptoniphilus obesi TaxID=1472765 RepID=UPI0004B8AB26|nr:DUF4373 domain-containing protein [Peptoniphilus obesi]